LRTKRKRPGAKKGAEKVEVGGAEILSAAKAALKIGVCGATEVAPFQSDAFFSSV
jgi:hypothetical protein